jgi:hypothetical protein
MARYGHRNSGAMADIAHAGDLRSGCDCSDRCGIKAAGERMGRAGYLPRDKGGQLIRDTREPGGRRAHRKSVLLAAVCLPTPPIVSLCIKAMMVKLASTLART